MNNLTFPKIFSHKYNLIIFNFIFSVFFIYLEIYISFENSSKSILSNHMLNGKIDDEFLIFGYFLQNFYDITLSILNIFSTNNERLVLHIIFLVSPLLWIILFNILYLKKKSLTILIFFSLFCNPFFVDFIHYSWRQSIALSVFLIIWSLNLKHISSVLLSSVSTAIHVGILPTVSLMIIFETFKDKLKLVLSIFFLIIISFIIIYIFPFPDWLIPDYFPYYERLTLSFDADSYKNARINNVDGDFILRYYLVGLLPILFITISLLNKKFSILSESKHYNLILAGSFPLVLLTNIPTANRLSYFFIFICMIYGPEIFFKFLKLFINSKISISGTFLITILGHFVIYIYFMT